MGRLARLAGCIAWCGGLLLQPGAGAAEGGPRPPCAAAAPLPDYAEPGNLPATRVWTGEQLDAAWAPPPCLGWRALPFRALGATAGRFHHRGDATGLLARFGAISALPTIRYWSVSDKAWQDLVTSASALGGPDPRRRRPGFAPAELAGGADRYFAQDDNRSTGEVVYRLRVRELAPCRLVVATENTSPVRYLLFPLSHP